jgi:hypothetical protein
MLSGTGGQLPQGPTGATGTTGAAGPPGPVGKIELVVCRKVKQKKKTVNHCTSRLVSGPVKFTTASARVAASTSRADVTTTGYAVRTRDGAWRLVLSSRRELAPGRYTLSLRERRASGG